MNVELKSTDGKRLKGKARQVQRLIQESAKGRANQAIDQARPNDAGQGGVSNNGNAKGGEKGGRKLAGLGSVPGEGLRSSSGRSGPKAFSPALVGTTYPKWVSEKALRLVEKLKDNAAVAQSRVLSHKTAALESLHMTAAELAPVKEESSDGSLVLTEHPSVRKMSDLQKAQLYDLLPRRKDLVHEVTDPELLKEVRVISGHSPTKPTQVLVHAMPSGSEVHSESDVMHVTMEEGKSKHAGSERHYSDAGTCIESGDELIQAVAIPPAIGGVTSVVPEGGILAITPANPRFIDGCRVTKLFEAFDQFRYLDLTFSYEHVANAFTAGQLIMAFINQFSDPIVIETGFQAARDAYSRTGKAMFQVTQDRTCRIAHPLLKWYYTATQSDADLEMPGFLVVITTQPLSNSSATPTPLGTLTMHYHVELRSPSIEGVTTQQFADVSASFNFTSVIGGNGNAISLLVAASGLPANLTQFGAVYWGTIVSADDSGTGSSVWRTWADSNSEDVHVMAPGNLLIWRPTKDGAGNSRILFFPTLDAAMSSEGTYGVGPLWTGTQAMPVGAKGFKLWNVNGCNVEGSNE